MSFTGVEDKVGIFFGRELGDRDFILICGYFYLSSPWMQSQWSQGSVIFISIV